MGRRGEVISIVEAAYAPASTEDEWLDGLVRAATPSIAEGLGACAYVYEASRAPLQVGAFAERELGCSSEIILGAVRGVDDDYVAMTWRKLSFGLGSQLVPFEQLPAAKPLLDAGVRDMLAINAYDPSGIGVWLGAPLPKERRLRPGEPK